jgi:hypothetical protein
MTKTHLENTKDGERWYGNNKKTRMLINNDKIATRNTWTLNIHVRNTLRGARLNRKIIFLAKRGNKGC